MRINNLIERLNGTRTALQLQGWSAVLLCWNDETGKSETIVTSDIKSDLANDLLQKARDVAKTG